MNISFLLIYISAHIYLLFCLVLVGVRLVWVSVAVSFSQFVEHVTCVCGCRHGLKRECVPPLPLDGEGYNLIRDVCRDVAHLFDQVDGVLGESDVHDAISCGWSRHDRIKRMARAWLSESYRSRPTGRHEG
jgi:hypothetical protein